MRMLLASTLLLSGLGFACGQANPDGPTTLTTAPVVTSLSVNHGITGGGELLDLKGTFRLAPTVTVGGVMATMINADINSLSLLTPPHAVGVTDIVVTHRDGQATTLTNAFTYTAPWVGDFNGVWNGLGGMDWHVALQFTIENDRLTSVKCGTAAARTFATPPVVAGGAFTASEAGLEMTGSLISDTAAGGLIKLPSCDTDALRWWVTRN